jgi:hypothetical protein
MRVDLILERIESLALGPGVLDLFVHRFSVQTGHLRGELNLKWPSSLVVCESGPN